MFSLTPEAMLHMPLALIGTPEELITEIKRRQREWDVSQIVFSGGADHQMERLARESADFSYHPTLTREPPESGWRGLRGRVQDSLSPEAFQRLTQEPLVPTRWQVMLCGNPGMIASVTAQLSDLGFQRHHRRSPGQIHTERYW